MDPDDNIWAIYIKVSYLGPHGSTKLLARFTNSVIGGLLGGTADRPQHATTLEIKQIFCSLNIENYIFADETDVFVPCS